MQDMTLRHRGQPHVDQPVGEATRDDDVDTQHTASTARSTLSSLESGLHTALQRAGRALPTLEQRKLAIDVAQGAAMGSLMFVTAKALHALPADESALTLRNIAGAGAVGAILAARVSYFERYARAQAQAGKAAFQLFLPATQQHLRTLPLLPVSAIPGYYAAESRRAPRPTLSYLQLTDRFMTEASFCAWAVSVALGLEFCKPRLLTQSAIEPTYLATAIIQTVAWGAYITIVGPMLEEALCRGLILPLLHRAADAIVPAAHHPDTALLRANSVWQAARFGSSFFFGACHLPARGTQGWYHSMGAAAHGLIYADMTRHRGVVSTTYAHVSNNVRALATMWGLELCKGVLNSVGAWW